MQSIGTFISDGKRDLNVISVVSVNTVSADVTEWRFGKQLLFKYKYNATKYMQQVLNFNIKNKVYKSTDINEVLYNYRYNRIQ